MADPRLSVAMIVKNEEALLPQCLGSIKGLWDELIVVDTGSQDRTVEIAESFGATVHHHPWEGDFAKARNQSLGYATGDWVFIIDADETLDAEGIALLRAAIRESQADLVAIREISVSRGGNQQSGHTTIRLWRNGRGFHYEGAVHNELVFAGKVAYVPARLYHYGYDLDRAAMIAKFERTTGILKREMERDPDNPKWSHYLAISYHTENAVAEALDMALHSIATCGGNREALRRWLPNYYLAAACQLSLGDLDGAARHCEMALDLMDMYLDAWAVLTSVHFIRKDSGALAEAAARYLSLRAAYQENPEPFDFVPMHTLNHEQDVHLRLALDAANRDDLPGFEVHYHRALDCARQPEQVVQNAARYLARIGQTDRAFHLLERHLLAHPACFSLIDHKIRLLLDQGRRDEARETLDAARGVGYPETDALFQSAVIDLVSGNPARARTSLDTLLEREPDHTEARINLGLALERLNLPEEAEMVYLDAINRDPEKLDAAINLGNLYARHGKMPEAIAFLEKVVERDPQQSDVCLKLIRLYWDSDDVDRLLIRALRLGHDLGLSVSAAAIQGAADLGRLFVDIGRRLRILRKGLACAMAFELAQLLLPDQEEPLVLGGEVQGSMGNYPQAVAAFEQALRLNPRSLDAFRGMAAAYEAMGAHEAAALCADKIREIEKTPTVH